MDSDDSDDVRRWTTVHSRYHVLGFLDRNAEDGELIEAVQTRAEAFKVARAYIGPRDFARVQVFDSMARLDGAQLWEVTAKDSTVLERRATREVGR